LTDFTIVTVNTVIKTHLFLFKDRFLITKLVTLICNFLLGVLLIDQSFLIRDPTFLSLSDFIFKVSEILFYS